METISDWYKDYWLPCPYLGTIYCKKNLWILITLRQSIWKKIEFSTYVCNSKRWTSHNDNYGYQRTVSHSPHQYTPRCRTLFTGTKSSPNERSIDSALKFYSINHSGLLFCVLIPLQYATYLNATTKHRYIIIEMRPICCLLAVVAAISQTVENFNMEQSKRSKIPSESEANYTGLLLLPLELKCWVWYDSKKISLQSQMNWRLHRKCSDNASSFLEIHLHLCRLILTTST